MTTLNLDIVGRDKGATALFRNLSKEADKTHTSLQKVQKTTTGFGSLTGLAFKAAGVAAVGFGLKVASGNEQARISFTTMLGSAQKADVFLRQLQAFAAKTPFEFPELQTAAQSLISAGVNANKVIPIMRTLGDVTSGMGTGAEGVKRATVAIQQMNAAGKITAEDLNQLRDAGIPVYDLLAAATGRSKEAVAGLAAQGKLGRKELEQLMTALESGKGLEKFNGMMEKQAQSLAGMVSTLKDVGGQMLAGFLEPLIPILKVGIGAFTEMGDGAKTTFAIIAGSGAALAVGATGAAKLSGAFQTLGVSAKAANIAVGSVGVALAGATLLFGLWATNVAKARQETSDLTDALVASNGAIDESIVKTKAKALQDDGSAKSAEQFGISLDTLTRAHLGEADAIAEVNAVLDEHIAAQEAARGTFRGMQEAESASSQAARRLKDDLAAGNITLEEARKRAEDLAGATQKTATKQETLAEKSARAKKELDRVREAMFKAANAALQLQGSEDGVEAAIDDATASIKENGRHLDKNTEKGRNNREALRNIASASNQYRQALIDQKAPQDRINRATDDARESFIKVARQMGLGRKEAGRLADQFGLTRRKTDEAARATRSYDSAINALNSKRINLVANYKATATKAAVEFFKTVPGSQASGFSQLPRGGPSRGYSINSMIGGPASPPVGSAQGGPTLGASRFNVTTPGLANARAKGQAWDDVALAAYSAVAASGQRAIGLAGQKYLDSLGAGLTGAPGGSVGTYSAGMAATIARLRAVGARSFTTYPGHHPSMNKARDVTPHNWRIANTARASSGVWYVIYQMRIASKNHGNSWRQYVPHNHNGDWQHRRHVHVAWYDKGGLLRPGWTMAYNGTGRNERVTPAGSSGNTYIINAPNYVGDKNDLVRALVDLDKQHRLAVIKR